MRYTQKSNVPQFETADEIIEFAKSNPDLAIKQMNAGIHHVRSSTSYHAKQKSDRAEFKAWKESRKDA